MVDHVLHTIADSERRTGILRAIGGRRRLAAHLRIWQGVEYLVHTSEELLEPFTERRQRTAGRELGVAVSLDRAPANKPEDPGPVRAECVRGDSEQRVRLGDIHGPVELLVRSFLELAEQVTAQQVDQEGTPCSFGRTQRTPAICTVAAARSRFATSACTSGMISRP